MAQEQRTNQSKNTSVNVINVKPLWFLAGWQGVSEWNDWRSNLSNLLLKSEDSARKINQTTGVHQNSAPNKEWKSIFSKKANHVAQQDAVVELSNV